jgi:hypothetical protein
MAMSNRMWLRLKLRFYQNRLSEIFSRPWSDLRGISNSYAARSTILIPLIGYWAIFNDRLVDWLNLAREFVGAPITGQISTRVLWLYMGLCAIALGTFIYALRCPQEVKKYGDYKDYVNGDGPAMSDNTMDDIQKQVEDAGYALERPIAKQDYLELHFRELDYSEPISRFAVSVCFAFGFSILTVLSGQVFWKVLSRLYQSPFGI